jgi:hypothetical protein
MSCPGFTSYQFCSECSPLQVGCDLKYWNGTSWRNADEILCVESGKFSDGTYCYTVVNGVITSKTSCVIDYYVTKSFAGVNITFTARDGGCSPGNPETTIPSPVGTGCQINIAFTYEVDGGLQISDSTSIVSNTSSVTYNTGSTVVSVTIDSVSWNTSCTPHTLSATLCN